MKRQLYTIDKGGGYSLLISFREYRKIMYEQTIPDSLVFNPFMHLIQGEFSFIHQEATISVAITIKRGRGTFIVRNDDELIFNTSFKDFYRFYKFQIDYYNKFGIPLVFHLRELNLIDEEKHCAILFYPPIKAVRSQWDVMEIRKDYYIHNMGENRWCLYHWVSGEEEKCMDIYVTNSDIEIVIDEFNNILDDMEIYPADEISNWSEIIYNQDGSFYTKKC